MSIFRRVRHWTLLAVVLMGLISSLGVFAISENTAKAAPTTGTWVWEGQNLVSHDMIASMQDFFDIDVRNLTLTKQGDKYKASPRYYCIGKSAAGGKNWFGFMDFEVTLSSGNSGSLLYKVRDCPGYPADGTTIPNIAITGTPPAGSPGGPAPTVGSIAGSVALTDDSRDEIPGKNLTPYFCPEGFLISLSGNFRSAGTTVNNSCAFDFSGLQPGTYTITASGNYTDPPSGRVYAINASKEAVVVAGQTTIIDLAQNVTPPPEPGDQADPCTKNSKGFGWAICPMQTMFMDAAVWIDKQILSLLKINACRIFNTEGSGLEDNCSTSADERASSEAFYKAWKIFRGLAFALLIILGLIMILSEFLGWEAFNSIAVRKTLPKMVAAAMVIPLLWPILRLVTVMANDSANAIEQLIQAPFMDLSHRVGVGDIATATILTISGLGAAVAGAVAFIFIGGGTVFLALIGSIVLFAGQALFVIAVRDMVFFALVIASAVAVVCGIFDPFKVVFTMWRRYIIGIWLSIPGVAAVLIICKVMAVIAQIGHSEIGIFFAVVFVVVGYVMFLPILKSIDKVSAQVDGLTDKVTSGAQKGLANFRNRKIKQNWGLFKQGALDNRFGRRFGALGERLGAAQAVDKAKGTGFVRQLFGRNDVAGQRLANYRTAVKAERAKDPILAAGQSKAQDDTVNALIVEGLNEDEIVARHLQIHGIGTARQARVNANLMTQAEAEEETRQEIRGRVRTAEANLGGRVGMQQTRLAAWQQLQGSGSAFRATANEYGNDWQTAQEALYRAGASLVHDGLIANANDLAGEIKGFKRHDARGASFGTIAGQAQASVEDYADVLAFNNGDRTAFNAGDIMTASQYDTVTSSAVQNASGPALSQERDETVDRYEQWLSQRVDNLGQAVVNAQTPQERQAAERAYFQHLAQVADFRNYQAGMTRGAAAELAPLMEMQLPPGLVASLGIQNWPAGTPTTNEGLIRAIQSMYEHDVPLPDVFAAMRQEMGKAPQGAPVVPQQGGGNVPQVPQQGGGGTPPLRPAT